jgi:hypothetical protein
VRVEFYTQHYHVSGDIQLARWRLADYLNDPAQGFVVMESAIREPLTEPGQPSGAEMARASEFLQISKRSIILAIPHASLEFEAARQQLLSTLTAEPRQLSGTFFAPPFEIKGTIHIRRLFNVRQAMDDLTAEFVQMTDAEVNYLPDPRIRIAAELIVVNRRLAELFTATADRVASTSRGFRTS